MSGNSKPRPTDLSSSDVVSINRDTEAEDWQEASEEARIWSCAVPVVLVHLALIYALARLAFDFDFKLPAYLHGDRILVWLWANGAAIGLGLWFWKKGRIPVAAGKWLHGRRVRWLILMWLCSSLAWFLIPAVLSDAWDMLLASVTDW